MGPVPSTLPLTRQSVSWRVNAEPFVFLGGGRALLLQVAHPKVAAGVEQHSTYATDPWRRLFRTVDVMAKLTFARPEVSRAQAELLARVHRHVVGTTENGKPYGALDADLLLWVWATLCDTALLVYERVRPPLSPRARLRYYDEWTLVAEACGVPIDECPPTWDDFQSYVAHMVRDELHVSEAARSVARATMTPPLPWPLGPVTGNMQRLVTVGLLPREVREAYGFRWDGGRKWRLRRFFEATAVAGGAVPRPIRELGMRYVVERRAS